MASHDSSEVRFAAYVTALVEVIGHADRATPLRDYCTGLLMRPWCTGQGCGRTDPYPVRGQAVRTYFGRPSSSMRFRTWTATSISVARRSSVRERSPSPITRLNRPMVASARARAL